MRKVTCYCDNIIDFDFPEILDMKDHPGYYNEIYDGTFQSVTCSECGNLLKPELEVQITDSSTGLDLYYISESDRTEFLHGDIECPAPKIVIGFPELVEKIKLHRDNIDDGAVEVIKYFLRKKAGSDDITIYFDHREGEMIVFHILGLKQDQIAVTPVPVSVYNSTLESMKADMDSELYQLILAPPYISSNKISVLEDE